MGAVPGKAAPGSKKNKAKAKRASKKQATQKILVPFYYGPEDRKAVASINDQHQMAGPSKMRDWAEGFLAQEGRAELMRVLEDEE